MLSLRLKLERLQGWLLKTLIYLTAQALQVA